MRSKPDSIFIWRAFFAHRHPLEDALESYIPSSGEFTIHGIPNRSTHMPFSKTFFAKGFGMCVDQFGIPWMVNSPLEGM